MDSYTALQAIVFRADGSFSRSLAIAWVEVIELVYLGGEVLAVQS